MQLGVRGRIGQLPGGATQAPPRAGRQRRQHLRGGLVRIQRADRRMRRRHQRLQQVDITLGVELGVQLLPQRLDLELEEVEKRSRRPRVASGQRLGPLAEALEKHLAVAHRAQRHREPAELRAQRGGPLRLDQRAEGAQVRAQLARRHARLVHGLRILAGAHERVVAEDRRDRLGEHRSDDFARRRLGGDGQRGHLGGLHGARAEGPYVFRCGVRGSRPRRAQAVDQRRHDGIVSIGAGDLDLDLAKTCSHPAPVSHRHLVVDDLCHAAAIRTHQPHAAPDGGESCDSYQLRLADVSTHQREGGGGRFFGPAWERNLVPFQQSVAGRRGQLQGPPLARPVAK